MCREIQGSGDLIAVAVGNISWLQALDESSGELHSVQQPSLFGIEASRSGATFADRSGSGSGSQAWAPLPLGFSDAWRASGSLGASTHWLTSTGYGFAIPSTATINGIQVEIPRMGASLADSKLRLIDDTSTIQATDRADTLTPWPSAWTDRSYGSQTDLWGTAWTPAKVNSPNFGVALSAAFLAALTGTADVKPITVIVFYTTPGAFITTADAVVYGSKPAELRTDGMIRKDATGAAFGPVAIVQGDLPRIPPPRKAAPWNSSSGRLAAT
jgi:hypothetical protein